MSRPLGWRQRWRSKIEACLQTDDQRLEIKERLASDSYFKAFFYINRTQWFIDQVKRLLMHGACNIYIHGSVTTKSEETKPSRHRVGKSYAALVLCLLFDSKFTVEHQVAFTASDFQSLLKNLGRYGAWVLKDELGGRTGAGSGREKIEFPKWLEQGSATRTSTVICSVGLRYLYGINYYVEMYGVNHQKNYSMGWLVNPAGIGLGWLVFNKPPKHIVDAYEAMKKVYTHGIQDRAGAEDTGHEDKVQELIDDERFKQCESLRDTYALVQDKWPTASAREVEKIARLAFKFEGTNLLNKGDKEKPVSRGIISGNLSFHTVRQEENPQVVLMMPSLYEELKSQGKLPPTKKFKPKYLEAMVRYYSSSITREDLADEYGVEGPTLTNSYAAGGWIAICLEEIAGHLAEYAINRLYFPDYTHLGGNEAPDLLKESQMVEVKLRRRKTSPNIDHLSTQERQNPINTTLVIVTLGRRLGIPSVTIKFYTINQPNQQINTQEDERNVCDKPRPSPNYYT